MGLFHSGFYEQGAGTAEGIKEWLVTIPFAKAQNGCGNIFLHGGGDAFGAVASFVKRASTEIDTDAGAIFVNIEVELKIGKSCVHIGSFSVGFAKLIDDCIFENLSGIVGVAQLTVGGVSGDGERFGKC